MIKNPFQLATIGVLALALSTSSALAKDKKGKGKGNGHKKWKKEHRDNGNHYGHYKKAAAKGYRDREWDDDRRESTKVVRFNYRNPGDYSYRTRYRKEVVVYEDRSYGYNHYDLQSVLSDEGYYDGPIDGVWGPRSRHALVRFQKNRGWRDDGIVDGRLIATFNIGY